jgi:hypothetical protein
MDPATIALISSIPSLIKGGMGIYQLAQSKKYADTPRPDYEIPGSIMNALDIQKNLATQQDLPGQEAIVEGIKGRTAEGVAQAKEFAQSPLDILSVLSNMKTQESKMIRDVDVAGEQFQMENYANLAGAYTDVAPYEEKKFQVNEMAPYLQAMQTARQLSEAGWGNIYSGVSDMSGIGASAMNYEYLKDLPPYAFGQ